jgi:predicted Zn-dependent protease
MKKVITLEPTTKLWYENLAQILRDAGKPDEAQKVLDQYEARALRL